ncbi:MAG: hypothetical protein WDO69_05275 [Pseudomonadota bacterium]
MAAASQTETAVPAPSAPRDPRRGVILLLAAAASLGTMAGLIAGLVLSSPLLVDGGLILGISTGVLVGVSLAQKERALGAATSKPGGARSFWRRKKRPSK